MQILLQHLAEHWLMAGEPSPVQRQEIFEFLFKLLGLLPAMALASWSFIVAAMSTTYLTTCQFLDKSEGAIAFFAVVLIMLGIGLNVIENRSAGIGAASLRFFKIDLRMQDLSSGCLIVGLLLLLLLFSRFVSVNGLGHHGV